MKILEKVITLTELRKMAMAGFGDLVKVVVDVERGILAVDAELHADLETVLLENGSLQSNLWGINFYPDLEKENFIEFDSMINIRPSAGNRSRGVENEDIKRKIVAIAEKWVSDGSTT